MRHGRARGKDGRRQNGARRLGDLVKSGTRAAAVYILIYAVVIGFTDNYVRVIAAEVGLWQFHAMRSVMAALILAAVAVLSGLSLRPARPGPVAARSVVHALAMLLYFAGLGFLPVPQVAAGLFTAPFFVLLIARLAYGTPIRPVQVVAVVMGFAGILLVLGPEAGAGFSPVTALPVAAGFFYALGNIATRAWTPGERAEVLTGGFFIAIGVLGVVGMAVLALHPVAEADFLTRGPVWPSRVVLFWTFVQAAGSLFAVTMMVRGYQATEASRAAVLEYVLLPVSALWGLVLWAEVPGAMALIGMALIVAAGVVVVRNSEA